MVTLNFTFWTHDLKGQDSTRCTLLKSKLPQAINLFSFSRTKGTKKGLFSQWHRLLVIEELPHDGLPLDQLDADLGAGKALLDLLLATELLAIIESVRDPPDKVVPEVEVWDLG